jgi:signal transduction histidine kinase
VTNVPRRVGNSQRPPASKTSSRTYRQWPFAPLAPLTVLVLGVAVALTIGVLGLVQLARIASDHASARAELLATVVGERLASLPEEERETTIRTAASRTGAEYMLLEEDGRTRVDATLGVPDGTAERVIAESAGEATTRLGRTRFFAHHVKGADPVVLVAFVPLPSSPESAPGLLAALLALTTLLIGTASAVAYVVARDAEQDIAYVTQRVRGMAHVSTEPAGEPVPVRTMDEVGALTSAFNDLVGRFSVAEQAYRGALARAHTLDRERADLLAAVSHELRSPLNAILGFADVLLEEVDGPLPPSAREEIEQIRASGQHLSELVADILEFSAIDSGQIQIKPERVPLLRVASELLRESQAELRDKPVKARVEGEESAVAWADPLRVRQILANVIGNAVKFTQRGEIVVRVEVADGEVVTIVRDTGPGISRAERQAIFEEYKQGEGPARRRGTGLGLAIARRLALIHGGRIELDSEVGKGSTFAVFLPAPRDSLLPPSRPSAPREAPS